MPAKLSPADLRPGSGPNGSTFERPKTSDDDDQRLIDRLANPPANIFNFLETKNV
jgi:hypothetical protein